MSRTLAHDPFRNSLRTPTPQMAAELQEAIGQRLVAYATGNRSPKVVGQWAQGIHEPQGDKKDRLRALYRTFLVLAAHESPDTIRAWLVGANPSLADAAPIEALRERRGAEVVHAAEDFVVD